MEILLETFFFFSCAMFWFVFFHKQGTLGRLKKVETSLRSKIEVLEHMIETQRESGVEDKLTKPLKESKEEPPALAVASQTQEQGIESMLERHHAKFSFKKELQNKNANTNVSEEQNPSQNGASSQQQNQISNQKFAKEASEDQNQKGLNLNEKQTLEELSGPESIPIEPHLNSQEPETHQTNIEDISFQQAEKVQVYHGQKAENFEDIINLSKALESSNTNPRS